MPGAAFTVGRNRRQKAQPAKKLAFPVSKMRSWVSPAVSSMAPPGFNAGSIPQARGRTGEGRGLAICPGVAFGKASRCIAVDFSPELFVSCGVQTADTLLNGYPGAKTSVFRHAKGDKWKCLCAFCTKCDRILWKHTCHICRVLHHLGKAN